MMICIKCFNCLSDYNIRLVCSCVFYFYDYYLLFRISYAHYSFIMNFVTFLNETLFLYLFRSCLRWHRHYLSRTRFIFMKHIFQMVFDKNFSFHYAIKHICCKAYKVNTNTSLVRWLFSRSVLFDFLLFFFFSF